MRSSDGHHWIALDHIRALAALLVFTWHFTHGQNGHPIPFGAAPTIFPLAIFDEGHTGVSLFMVLSGYLFAKLLDGKQVNYWAFYWNRALRLAPLLMLVILIVGVIHLPDPSFSIKHYLRYEFSGFWRPNWPNGGWSIAVELHFYVLLPILLAVTDRWRMAPIAVVFLAILSRLAIFSHYGSIQALSYYTIVGRVDQFCFGIFVYSMRDRMRGRHRMISLLLVAFLGYFYAFDHAGGYYGLNGFPSRSPLWVIDPTIEGAFYATFVAYYDTTFRPPNLGISWFVGRIGCWSYSIYLLHQFIVFQMADLIDHHLVPLSNFYLTLAFSIPCFLLTACLASISYEFYERPFLQWRLRYARPPLHELKESPAEIG